jgi:glycosyltransferase involved in cell wall biosynthesis
MNDMNVLYVINTLHQGGAEVHLLLLARGLQSRGVTCEVAFFRSTVAGGSIDLRERFEAGGIRTHYLASEKSYDVRAALHLRRLLATRRWDVMHSHLPRSDAAAAICRMLGSRQVWISTLHHPYDNAYSAARLIPALAPMWRRADGVIAVSEPLRQWAISRLGLSSGSVQTITHGIELGTCGRTATPPSMGAARFRIGSIGRYEERKGHETLIRAMVPILKEFPQAELVIAGHDPWGHGEVLRALITELNLQGHVRLTGFLSDKEAFFADIDVFAFASRSEGFGIVLLEAMAAGKPAVVSDISPLKDIICPGTSGLVADRDDATGFAEAIASLFRNQDRLERIGEEGRRRVAAEFSQERMVERTLQYYRDVIHRVERRSHQSHRHGE